MVLPSTRGDRATHMHTRRVLRALAPRGNFPAGDALLRLQQHRSSLIRRQLIERRPQPAYRLGQHRRILRPGLTRRRIDAMLLWIVAGTRDRHESPPPSITPLIVDA